MALPKARSRKHSVYIEEALSLEMCQAVAAARTTISNFVQDAVAVRLRKHEAPIAYVRAGREARDATPRSLFDLSKCHPAGWPKVLPEKFWRGGAPSDPIENLRTSLRNGAEANVFKLMFRAWEAAGLGEYTEAHFAETLRVLAE